MSNHINPIEYQSFLTEQLTVLQAEQADLWEKQRPIKERLHTLYEEMEQVKAELAKIEIEEMNAEGFVPTHGNWFSEKELKLVLIGDVRSMELYRHADHLLSSRFGFSFARDGYCSETEQTKFHIALTKGDKELTKFVRDVILYFLPHLKWQTKGRYDCDLEVPEKRFDIFDHNLSAGGVSYDLVYTQDDKWIISGSYRRHEEYASLEAALDYIEQNLWYERLNKDGKRTSCSEVEEDEEDW